MAAPGEIVIVDFPGAQGTKRRPAIVVSTALYHQTRPDCVVALITSNVAVAKQPTDHVLRDWQSAGLHSPSAMRSFFWTIPRQSVGAIAGRVSDFDWKQIVSCIGRAIEL